jgi:hypothetical protein
MLFQRLRAGAIGLAGVGVLAGTVWLAWNANLGPELGKLPGVVQGVQRERQRGHRLDEKMTVAMSVIQGKQEALAGLLEGRLTLLQTAARFRDLDARQPEFALEQLRLVQPGDTDDERYCWSVIDWVRFALHDEPSRAETLCEQLEAELEALLESGPVRLP